ncbi:MAG: hypothetical protein ACI8PQ_003478, partial [Planctomycetota bacterium]
MNESEWKQADAPSSRAAQDADQARIEAALMRRYRAPAGLGGRLRDAVTGVGVQPATAQALAAGVSAGRASSATAAVLGSAGHLSMLRLLRGPALCLAAAGALLLFLAPRLGSGGGDSAELLVAGRGEYPLRGDAECADPVSESWDDPAAMDSPDLASLYHEVVSMAGSHEAWVGECVHPGDGDSLLESLR